MPLTARVALLLLLLIAPVLAAGAPTSPSASSEDQPMRVMVVRSNEAGCEPHCMSWISAEGRITNQTPAAFRRVLKEIGQAKMPVFINSGGGDVDASLAIGRLIRARGLDIAVSRTAFAPCLAGSRDCDEKTGKGRRGTPISGRAWCASACSFTLAGGVRRSVPYGAYVGVHQIAGFVTFVRHMRTYTVQRQFVEGVPVEVRRKLIRDREVSRVVRPVKTSPRAYARLAGYFAEMGITAAINPLVQATPHTSIHWMTRDELRQTALITDALDAEELVRRANMALKPASVVAAIEPPKQLSRMAAADPSDQVFSAGWVAAGKYRGTDVRIDVRFEWRRDQSFVSFSVAPSASGLRILAAKTDEPRLPDAKDRSLAFDYYARLPALVTVARADEICSAGSDSARRIQHDPWDHRRVSGATLFTGAGAFKDVGSVLAAVCPAL